MKNSIWSSAGLDSPPNRLIETICLWFHQLGIPRMLSLHRGPASSFSLLLCVPANPWALCDDCLCLYNLACLLAVLTSWARYMQNLCLYLLSHSWWLSTRFELQLVKFLWKFSIKVPFLVFHEVMWGTWRAQCRLSAPKRASSKMQPGVGRLLGFVFVYL